LNYAFQLKTFCKLSKICFSVGTSTELGFPKRRDYIQSPNKIQAVMLNENNYQTVKYFDANDKMNQRRGKE